MDEGQGKLFDPEELESRSEMRNRFWRCTKVGLFVLLAELAEVRPEGVAWLTDLCLCTTMFLRSEAWAGNNESPDTVPCTSPFYFARVTFAFPSFWWIL